MKPEIYLSNPSNFGKHGVMVQIPLGGIDKRLSLVAPFYQG